MTNARLLLLVPVLWLAASMPALADDPKPGTGQRHERQERREEFCNANPQTCETRKEGRKLRQQWCKDNPDKCQKLKDERDDRRALRTERRADGVEDKAAAEDRSGPPR